MELFGKIARISVYGVSSIVILLTLLPLFKFSHWTIRIGDFPRVQIAVVCIACFLAIIALRNFHALDIVVLLALIGCTVYQITRIYPYTIFATNEVERTNNDSSPSNIKLLISNVLIENRNADELIKRIDENEPDIILLAEVDKWWVESVASLKENYPYTLSHPLDNAYGIAFYSRLKLKDPKIRFLVEDDIPSVETEITLPNGKMIKFYGLHPRPPFPTESLTTKTRDAELLIVAKKIKDSDQPTIVAGDFNDVAWSETTQLFQNMSGLLDSRVGRGFYNSFHVDYFFLRFPLDHVFQSNHFRLVDIKRLDSIESDHFPMFISLTLEGSAKLTQDEPEPDAVDEKEADRKIEEGKKE